VAVEGIDPARRGPESLKTSDAVKLSLRNLVHNSRRRGRVPDRSANKGGVGGMGGSWSGSDSVCVGWPVKSITRFIRFTTSRYPGTAPDHMQHLMVSPSHP